MAAKGSKRNLKQGKTVVKKSLKRPLFVLAHGAGHYPKGCSHPDVKAWSKQLKHIGDVVDVLKYPKPFNLMANMCAAHTHVIEKAMPKSKQPIVLVGLGMGARVAVHMMSGTPGDDGKPLSIPPSITKGIHKMIAINYPLLKVGSREVRSKPLLALKKGGPSTLFISGPKDAHMDQVRLKSICNKMKVKTKSVCIPAGESEKPGAFFTELVKEIRGFAC
jgi:hypothetical protein